MNRRRMKHAPLRLDTGAYEQLRQGVLQRDHWTCQNCGALSNLEVHHIQYRSRSGEDTEENLITLCDSCHGQLHRGPANRRVLLE